MQHRLESPLDLFFLNKRKALILDGGLATELERKGEQLKDDLWSALILIEKPQMIKDVHLSYLQSGADIITSSSYQATFEGFAKKGINESDAKKLFALSITLAKEAVKEYCNQHKPSIEPLIAASIGCYGASLANGEEFRGSYIDTISPQDLKSFHRKRIAALIEAGADLLAFETVPCLKERAEVIIDILESEFPSSYAWISFSCKDGKHTNHGELFVDCVKLANKSKQVVAVGINCTDPIYIEDLLCSVQEQYAENKKHLLVYPNRGELWDGESRSWIPRPGCEHRKVVDYVPQWLARGASIIGGCCRTTPEDIQQVAQYIHNMENK